MLRCGLETVLSEGKMYNNFNNGMNNNPNNNYDPNNNNYQQNGFNQNGYNQNGQLNGYRNYNNPQMNNPNYNPNNEKFKLSFYLYMKEAITYFSFTWSCQIMNPLCIKLGGNKNKTIYTIVYTIEYIDSL